MQSFGDRIVELPAYQSLKDKYDTMSTGGQKAIVIGGIALVVLLIGIAPYNTYVASQDSLIEFEEKRSLIRDLLRTHQESQATAGTTRPPGVSDVQNRIDSILMNSQILPEQKQGVTTDATTSLISESLVAGVLKISLAQLNLRQIVNISADLASIEGAKLQDILMDASAKDARYYDVIYRVVVLKSNIDDEPPAAGAGGPPPPPSQRGR